MKHDATTSNYWLMVKCGEIVVERCKIVVKQGELEMKRGKLEMKRGAIGLKHGDIGGRRQFRPIPVLEDCVSCFHC